MKIIKFITVNILKFDFFIQKIIKIIIFSKKK